MNESLLEAVATAMSDVSATEVMPRWRNLTATDVTEKTGPDDLVTVADKAAEIALTERLTSLLPGSTVVGEEAVAADRSVLERLAMPGMVWVIDPIDGTAAFAEGAPDFTIMVALVRDGQPLAGWILAPALGRIALGGGAFGVRLRPNDGASIAKLSPPSFPSSHARMIGLLGKRNLTDARRAELKAKETHFAALDGVTFAGIDYMRLATGEAHFALYGKSEPWDHLPGLALVNALGYEYARPDGASYTPHAPAGGLLIAPTGHLDAIRAVLLG